MNGKFRIAAVAAILAAATPIPASAQYDPYTQCLIDYCFGNYEGNPTGYEACRRWCARTTGGPYYAPPMVAKLD